MLANMYVYRKSVPKTQGISGVSYTKAAVGLTDVTPVIISSVDGKRSNVCR